MHKIEAALPFDKSNYSKNSLLKYINNLGKIKNENIFLIIYHFHYFIDIFKIDTS